MSDAPERIWVTPPYYTLSGEVPDIVWEPQWAADKAQAFEKARDEGVEYIRADRVEELEGAQILNRNAIKRKDTRIEALTAENAELRRKLALTSPALKEVE